MKKILVLILSVFVFCTINAQTKLVAPLVRNNPADTTYGTHYDTLGVGGLITVVSLANRNAHPLALRRKGMVAVVQDSMWYQLIGGIANANWTRINFSGGSGGIGYDSITSKGTVICFWKSGTDSCYDLSTTLALGKYLYLDTTVISSVATQRLNIDTLGLRGGGSIGNDDSSFHRLVKSSDSLTAKWVRRGGSFSALKLVGSLGSGGGGGGGITYPNTIGKYLNGYGNFATINDTVRNSLSAGTGISYNTSTGQISTSIDLATLKLKSDSSYFSNFAYHTQWQNLVYDVKYKDTLEVFPSAIQFNFSTYGTGHPTTGIGIVYYNPNYLNIVNGSDVVSSGGFTMVSLRNSTNLYNEQRSGTPNNPDTIFLQILNPVTGINKYLSLYVNPNAIGCKVILKDLYLATETDFTNSLATIDYIFDIDAGIPATYNGRFQLIVTPAYPKVSTPYYTNNKLNIQSPIKINDTYGTVGQTMVSQGGFLPPIWIGGNGSNVASAATITATGNLFHVTGTTTITSISGTNIIAGSSITIIFDGALTFTDGSNLKLAGNFVTTADDTITLSYDGINWYETARSIN